MKSPSLTMAETIQKEKKPPGKTASLPSGIFSDSGFWIDPFRLTLLQPLPAMRTDDILFSHLGFTDGANLNTFTFFQ